MRRLLLLLLRLAARLTCRYYHCRYGCCPQESLSVIIVFDIQATKRKGRGRCRHAEPRFLHAPPTPYHSSSNESFEAFSSASHPPKKKREENPNLIRSQERRLWEGERMRVVPIGREKKHLNLLRAGCELWIRGMEKNSPSASTP